MSKTILDIKDWYSIENVCTRLKASINDIYDLIEIKKLRIYGRVQEVELLAFKKLNDNARYGGKAKAKYSGFVRLNQFKLTTFIKYQTIEASSVSILSSKGLYDVKTEDDSPSWIYESQISKWKFIDKDESFLDFEYCAFPTKSKSGASYFADALDIFTKCSDGSETSDSSHILAEYRQNVSQYNVNTSYASGNKHLAFK